jgi:putative N6-adenine-specific DNA methylase
VDAVVEVELLAPELLRLAKLIRLEAARRTVLWNGALECRLYEFRIVAGSNRRASAR